MTKKGDADVIKTFSMIGYHWFTSCSIVRGGVGLNGIVLYFTLNLYINCGASRGLSH